MMVFVPVGNDVFQIVMGTGEHLYAATEDEFLEIINTFRVLE